MAPDLELYAGAGSASERTLLVDGELRTYRLFVPASAEPGRPVPVVFNFHGLGSSAREQELYSQLVPLAEREGFVLVSPQGVGEPARWRGAGISQEDGVEGPDVRFFDRLLEFLADRLCLNPQRVYVTGMSNGAFFSSVLACYRPDVVAAAAPVAGVYFPPGGCRGPVPLLAVHGRLDQVVPYGAGLIFGVIPYRGAEAYVAEWAEQNGCRERTVRRLAPHVLELRYEGCAADTALLAIEDGGHTWPGSAEVPRLGPTNQEVSAAELIWEFFERHPRSP
nr:lipolytic protein [uncultured bacterium]